MRYDGDIVTVLGADKQVAFIDCLANGHSIRATERIVGVHRDTVHVKGGEGCAMLLDDRMQNRDCKRVQVNEIWTFVDTKQCNVRDRADLDRKGDFWIWTALDADAKIIPAYRVRKRSKEDVRAFCKDLPGRMATGNKYPPMLYQAMSMASGKRLAMVTWIMARS